MFVTDGGSMPVTGHSSNNLDSGLDISQVAQSDAFMDIANETFGIEPEVVVEELDEIIEDEQEDGVADEQEGEGQEDPTAEEEEEVVTADTIYVVTLDGEEFEVNEGELLSGYQRQRDYTRKTQEVSEQRKQVTADLAMLAEERTKYTVALEAIIADEAKALDKYKDVDWADLRATNQNEFLMLQFEMQEVRQSLQAKVDARNAAYSQGDNEKGIAEQALIEREGKRVEELVEGWTGTEGNQLRIDLRTQSKTEGFTDDDEGLLKHAVVIKLLQKAKAYDDLQTKAVNVGKHKMERIVPKVIKSGAKGSVEQAAQVVANQNAMTKLNQTGRISDSISIFEQFL